MVAGVVLYSSPLPELSKSNRLFNMSEDLMDLQWEAQKGWDLLLTQACIIMRSRDEGATRISLAVRQYYTLLAHELLTILYIYNQFID